MGTANAYQSLAARTLLSKPNRQLTEFEQMVLWNSVGLAGESGEFLDYIKKALYHGHGVDITKVVEELGDILWYVAAVCTKFQLNLEDVMEFNVLKLRKRYPEGFTESDSLDRVDTRQEEIVRGQSLLEQKRHFLELFRNQIPDHMKTVWDGLIVTHPELFTYLDPALDPADLPADEILPDHPNAESN